MNTRLALSIGACLTLASFNATAHQVSVDGQVEDPGRSYITTDGYALKTGLGGCFRSGTFFDEDNSSDACEGREPEAEVAEAPAEVVEAPKPPEPTKAKIDTRDFSELALFDTNSAELTPAGLSAMQSMIDAVSEFKGVTEINVTGHTDSRGSEEYNQALSERRAQTVADLLAAEYPDAKMTVSGRGESEPAANNFKAEGRQQNRRVEVELTANRMIFN